MCQFISAIVMKNGDILCDPEHTDSHEDLLSKHNVRDGLTQQDKFVRIEFTPPKGSSQDNSNIFDTSKWTLKIDQSNTPDWFSKDKIRADMVARVQRMFVREERKILLGGCWILGDGADVKIVKNARIDRMSGSSRVDRMSGSSRVSTMYNSSRVDRMYDSSRVGGMYESSKIEKDCRKKK